MFQEDINLVRQIVKEEIALALKAIPVVKAKAVISTPVEVIPEVVIKTEAPKKGKKEE